MHMPPIIRRRVGGIETERLDSIDCLQHAFHFRPAVDVQENLSAGTHERQGLVQLAWKESADDVDPRYDRPVPVGLPPNEGKDAARCKAQDAPAAIEDRLADIAAEPDPALDAVLDPGQLNKRKDCRTAAAPCWTGR